MGADFSAPLDLRKAEQRLTLILDTDDLARILQLTHQSGHSVHTHVSRQIGNFLGQFGDGEQTIGICGHEFQDGVLDCLIGGLLGSQLLLAGVLLGQQFDFMGDELGQHGVGLDFGHFGNHGELLSLSDARGSILFHGINLLLIVVLFSLGSVLIIAHLL